MVIEDRSGQIWNKPQKHKQVVSMHIGEGTLTITHFLYFSSFLFSLPLCQYRIQNLVSTSSLRILMCIYIHSKMIHLHLTKLYSWCSETCNRCNRWFHSTHSVTPYMNYDIWYYYYYHFKRSNIVFISTVLILAVGSYKRPRILQGNKKLKETNYVVVQQLKENEKVVGLSSKSNNLLKLSKVFQ